MPVQRRGLPRKSGIAQPPFCVDPLTNLHAVVVFRRTHDPKAKTSTKMKIEDPILSVIIPVYNEGLSIRTCLGSVLSQKTEYPFEVIVVDDGSTDDTWDIVQSYVPRFPMLRAFRNDENKGKGFSVRRAYGASQARYVHILDGDDCFVSTGKVQKQIKTLEEEDGIFAVAHNTLVLHPKGQLSLISPLSEETYFTYRDCINNKFYFHTSSLMFRKVARELPEYFLQPEMRGDTAFSFYHAYTAKKGVKYCPDIHSVYNFHGSGLWSGSDPAVRFSINTGILERFLADVIKDPGSFEHEAVESRLNYERRRTSLARTLLHGVGTEAALEFLSDECKNVYREPLRASIFKTTNVYRFGDQLCDAIGRSMMLGRGYAIVRDDYKENTAAIIVSGLVPTGGGVFREIRDLVTNLLARSFRVRVFSTQVIDTSREVFEASFQEENVSFWLADGGESPVRRAYSLLDALYAFGAAYVYPFPSAHDIVQATAIQRGIGRNVVFDLVFDHGLSLGATLSAVYYFVVKTESQTAAFAEQTTATIVRVPPLMAKKDFPADYRPLKNGTLATATAAARSYKVENDYKYSFAQLVSQVMAATRGRHVHFGPLSDAAMSDVRAAIGNSGGDPELFVHIEWAADLGAALIDQGVDVFLPPFPICSARIAVEVLAAGIPQISHEMDRPVFPASKEYIVDPEQLTWRTLRELVALLKGLDQECLLALSKRSKRQFDDYHDLLKRGSALLPSAEQDTDWLPRESGLSADCPLQIHDVSEFGFRSDARELMPPSKAAEIKAAEVTILDPDEVELAPVEAVRSADGWLQRLRQLLRRDSGKAQQADGPTELRFKDDLQALRYVASHDDLTEVIGSDTHVANIHFRDHGVKEGRRITFSPERYAAANVDLVPVFGKEIAIGGEKAFLLDRIAVTRHFIEHGYREGRKRQ
jgi:hypothetical protein